MAEYCKIKDGKYFKSLSRKRFEYYEVLAPNDFTPKQPWGSFPNEKWDEWDPIGVRYPDIILGEDYTTHLPIHLVAHVTHDKEAKGISSTLGEGYYTFKPKAKLGKSKAFDGTPMGETYKAIGDGKFKEIPRSRSNPVFPGYLSWWGIDVGQFYKTSKGSKLLHHIKDLARKRYYVAGYARDPVRSHYGSNAFSTTFKDLLECYQNSRTDKPSCEIQMKVGGTLLYENEICYVAMIGLRGDEALESMKPLGDHSHCRPFQSNGLVDSDGIVVDFEKTPDFKAAYLISCVDDGNMFNWEQLAFGLYYPKSTLTLQCPKDKMTKSKVEHTFCISTQPNPDGEKWLCPNKLPI